MPGVVNSAAEPIISSVESTASLGVVTTEQGTLPLRSVSIQARIDQLLAEVQLKQGYTNPHADAIEATYIFPLPDRAAVTRFQARLGDRLIEGIIKERAAARKDYEEAIEQGHRAAIAEEERANVFTMRVGNIMPGETAEIELTLCLPLAYEAGEATLRFPLVVAPRYIPGKPLEELMAGLGVASDTDAVPDASRITPPILLPGYPYPVKLDIQVSMPVQSGKPQTNLPMEPISTNGTHSFWQARPGQKLDRDFILRFMAAGTAVASQALIAPDTTDAGQGTLSLTIIPPRSTEKAKTKPRRIVFVLDRSGSMDGWKQVAARRAMGRMIDTLSPNDHFALLAFDDRVEQYPSTTEGAGWYSGVEVQRYRAIEALARINARDGTEMAKPLTLAVQMLQSQPVTEDRILVLVTDGQVGNEDQILKKLQPHMDGLRIFTLGVDMAVNEGFLRRLAQLGGGTTEVVESEERLDAVMQRIHRRIAAPVLRDLKLHVEGFTLEPGSLVPDRLPDLFAEAPVVIQARCKLPTVGKVYLTGSDDAGLPWKQELSPQIQASPVLRSSWARTQVRAMEDLFASGQDMGPRMSERIVQHSIKYQVLSRFTAYVAIDRSVVVNPGGKPREIVQPVELPAGWGRSLGGIGTVFDADADVAPHPLFSRKPVSFSAPPRPRGHMACEESYVEPPMMELALEGREVTYPDRNRILKHTPPASMTSVSFPGLASYQRRAIVMLEEFDQVQAVNLQRAMRKLSELLRDLIDDLRSVRYPRENLAELACQLDLLLGLLAAGVTVLPDNALKVLRTFAGLPTEKSANK